MAGAEQPLLLAVSGGLDSVVLCALCHEAGISFGIAHCNFGLRGEESDRDAAFVAALAGRYGVQLHTTSFDTTAYAAEQKLSIQEAARDLRYGYFYKLIDSGVYSHVVLAHHADDNIETVMMHFFRGTGLQGLCGMPQVRDRILRPLLTTRRSELLQYAQEKGLEWVEDSSNQNAKYSRNYFRNELIPAIKKVYPQVEANIQDNIRRMNAIHSFYSGAVQASLDSIIERKGAEWWIPVLKLKKHAQDVLMYELIKPFGFGEKQVVEVVKLLDSGNGKFIANEKFQIVRHGRWLIIAPVNLDRGLFVIEKDDSQVIYPAGRLMLEQKDAQQFPLQKVSSVAQLDLSKIEFPLVLRKWKQGDYFYPLGMRKKKKLSRFFIDSKLAKHHKEAVWVLESGKKIIWVVGLRIDDRFKVTDSTRTILLIADQH